MNAACSFIGAFCVAIIWTFLEELLTNIWHFGDRFTVLRTFVVCFFAYIVFYFVGLTLLNHGIRQSTLQQKTVIYGTAMLYIILGSMIFFVARSNMFAAYQYVEDLQQLKDTDILSFTASYQDISLSQKTIHESQMVSITRLKQSLLHAKAYNPSHDEWLLEGALTVRLEIGDPLLFDWYVPKRNPDIMILKPNSNVYIVIDNNWLEDKL